MEKPDLLDTGPAVSPPLFPGQRPLVLPEPAPAAPSPPGLGARPALPELDPLPAAFSEPRAFPDQPPRAFPDQPPPGWAPRAICPRCKRENTPPCDACTSCGFSFLETSTIGSPASSGAGDLVGKVLNGKYRVLSVLGEGGFGIVYRVELVLFDTGNVFALKLLHPSLSQDANFRRRFLREAGLAMSLIHENTIQIREFGQTEDGHLFFTMDYCQGEPLKAVIARDGYLSIHRALHVIRQVLLVMKLAHERGIIHRDLKPENIFLEKDHVGRDFVKVGDFGLAKSFALPEGGSPKARPAGTLADDITRGGIVGTPRYMSPEQALGRDDLDQRSDLYAVGVILCECLYGRVPAERAPAAGAVPSPRSPAPVGGRASGSGNLAGRSPAPAGSAARVQAALSSPAIPYPGHAVPRAVWDIVRRALEPDRESRFQSAAEFLEAIDRLPEYTPAYIDSSVPAVKVSRGLGRVAVALVAAAVVGGGIYLLKDRLGAGAAGGSDASAATRAVPAGKDAGPSPGLGPEAGASPVASTPAGPATRPDSGAVPGRIAVARASLEGSHGAVLKGNGHEVPAAAGTAPPPPVRPARLSPFPAEGVKAFLSFKKGDVIRYQAYREGMVQDREIAYHIMTETVPGVYEVKVSPGDRLLTWILDEKENAWFQEFPLPDSETGELTQVTQRRWLKLPPPESVFDGDYIQGEMRIHRDRVDVKAPTVLPAQDLFAACLRVEFRQEDRVHYHYYKEGRGLVAIEVYEVREPVVPAAKAGSDATTRQALSAASVAAALAAPESATTNGQAAKVLVYARYLIAPEVRGASPSPPEATGLKSSPPEGRR